MNLEIEDQDFDIEISEIYNQLYDNDINEILGYIVEDLSERDSSKLIIELKKNTGDSLFKTSRHDILYDSILKDSLIKIFNSRATLSLSEVDGLINFANKL